MTKKKKATKKKATKKTTKKKATRKTVTKKKATKKKATKKKATKKKATKKKATKKTVAKKKATKKKSTTKKKASARKAPSKKSADVGMMDDLGIFALTAPDQPLDYDILEANSRSELIQRVRQILFVQHDGTCWVPLGAAFEEDDKWYQTIVKYD